MLNSIQLAASAALPHVLVLGKLGLGELILILAIAIVIFGPKNLPKLGKTFGETIKGFKQGIQEGSGEKPAEKADVKQDAPAEEPKKDDN